MDKIFSFAGFFTTPIFYGQEGRHGIILGNGAPLFYLCELIIITFCLYCFIILKYLSSFGLKFSNSASNSNNFQVHISFSSYQLLMSNMSPFGKYFIYDSNVLKMFRTLVIMCGSVSLSEA